MSARTATARAPRATPTPQRRAHRPALRLVAPIPRSARRLPFVGAVVGLLVTGLLGLLLLNTLAAQDAFRLHHLQEQSAHLSDEQQALEVAVAHDQSPTTLAARARALGLLPGSVPAFLRLPDGRLIGAVNAVPPPPPAPKPAAAVKPAVTKPAAAPAKPGTQAAATTASRPATHPAPAPVALHAAPTHP